jgi:cation transport ATPase
MGWFSKMVSGSIDKTVDSVGTALDGLFTSDEERLQAKQLITSEMNKFKTSVMEAQSKHDAEITARWKSDNEHSITRLVRPLAFISVLVVFYIIAFADGNIGGFTLNEKYIPVFEGLLYTMTIAYFGSRGAEKVTKSIKSTKQ